LVAHRAHVHGFAQFQALPVKPATAKESGEALDRDVKVTERSQF